MAPAAQGKTLTLAPLLPIAAVIFLLPFGRASEAAVLACLIGAVIVFVRAPPTRAGTGSAKFILMLWACYFAAALISTCDAIDPGKSWSTVAALIRFAPFALYVCWIVRDSPRLRALYFFTGVVAALWALDAWAQILTGYSLGGQAEVQRISGIFGADDLKLGPVLAVLSPFVLWSGRERFGRTAMFVALLFLLGPVLLAGERSAWLMYALAAIAFLWREAPSPLRFAAWCACACVIAALAIGIAWKTSPRFDARMQRTLLAFGGSPQGLDAALSGRMQIWNVAKKMYLAHPLTGVGVRGFRYAYPRFAQPDDRFLGAEACGVGEGACHPHQIILEILDDTGAIGFALWLIGAIAAVRAWRRAGRQARTRAFPASVALFVMLFPINTHLAFYSAWWGVLFWWLLTLWTAALFVGADNQPALSPGASAAVRE